MAWRVEVGDRIEADETICDISTDKIDTEVPAPVTGVVAEILVPVDETVEVGTVLARIADRPTLRPRCRRPPAAPAEPTGAAVPEVEPQPTRAAPVAQRRRPRGAGRRYSPVVQRIAAEHGIDLSQVRAPGAAGACASRTCSRSWSRRAAAPAAAASRRCTSRARTGPTRAVPAPALRRPVAVADAPADRRAHEALAGHRGALHDLDRGRHEPRRGGARRGSA